MPSRLVRSAGLVITVLFLFLLPGEAGAIAPSFICLTGKCHPSIAEKEYVHGPIGSGMCPLCHDDGRRADNLPPGHPEVRVGPATDKCLLCHEEISAMIEKGSVHTPVADGDCIDCHDSHGGENSFFLKFAPQFLDGARIIAPTCKACHDADDPGWFDEFHAKEAILDCVVCHNAHASSEMFQLTRYVKKVYLKAAVMAAAELRDDGKLDAAVEAYDKALKVFPNDPQTILLLADIYSAQEEWKKALTEYEKVMSLEPGNLEALVRAAEAAGHAVGPQAEMGYLKKALEVEESPELHYRVGVIYRNRGQLQEAVSEFSKAVRLEPGFVPAHTQLAEVFESMGMVGDAEEERRILRDLQKR